MPKAQPLSRYCLASPLNLMITGDGHTEIKVVWGAPMTDNADNKCVPSDPTVTEDDGSECPPNSAGSVIKGYQIERSNTGTDGWTTIAALTKSPHYLGYQVAARQAVLLQGVRCECARYRTAYCS